MCGVTEAGLVLGLISSSIEILAKAKELYETAKDAKGLPKKFRVAAENLDLVIYTLGLAEKEIHNIDEEALMNAKPVLERCKENAVSLKDIFDEVVPSGDASKYDRYKKAFSINHKSGKVKEYVQQIAGDMVALGQLQVYKDTQTMSKIKQAIEILSDASDDEAPHFSHSGSGNINNHSGSGIQRNYNNSGSGEQYNATTMTFGSRRRE